MRNDTYKNFVTAVSKADEKSFVWFNGAPWLDLTPKQTAQICQTLERLPFIPKRENQFGMTWYILPSGMEVRKPF